MALLWFEGFDQYGVDADLQASRKWLRVNGSGLIIAGTRSAKACKISAISQSLVLRVPGGPSTIIFGMAVKFNASQGRMFFISPDGLTQLTVTFVTPNTIQVHQAGTTLLGSGACTISVWHYLEIKIVFNSSAGAVQIRVDGTDIINLSGVNTMHASSVQASAAGILFGGYSSTTNIEMDDMYLCNSSGTVNNDFLGDCSIGLLVPDGDSSVQLARSAGSTNFSLVDEYPGDSGATYVSSSTAGHKDLYTLTSPAATSAVIAGAAVTADMRVTAGALRNCKLHLNGGTSDSATLAAPYTHGYRQFVRETHDGSNPWTVAALTSAVAGVEVV